MNKVSKESIEKKIVDKIFKKLSGKLTHCTLILENGFEVTGESACVDPANYDKVIGERIAYENAFEKIWAVEGYLLQEKLYLESKLQAEIDNGIYGYFKDGEEIDRPIGTRLRELSPATVVPFTEDLLTICRQELDIIIQEFKKSKRKSPERSTAIRKAIEATMWLGMDLKAIGTPNPYPESKNPNNTTVEPTADGLKL
jgi:hypothetical protein